jgi:hypothetical protein
MASVGARWPKRVPPGKNERLQNDGLRLSGDRRKRGEPLPSMRRAPSGGRYRSGAKLRNDALLQRAEPRGSPSRATSGVRRSSTVSRWEARTWSPTMTRSSSRDKAPAKRRYATHARLGPRAVASPNDTPPSQFGGVGSRG